MRMAAASALRTDGPLKMLALTLLLATSLLSGVIAQDTDSLLDVKTDVPRDMTFMSTGAPETDDPQGQNVVFPSVGSVQPSDETTAAAATTEAAGDNNSGHATQEGASDVVIATVKFVEAETPAPAPPSRGDGPGNLPLPLPKPVPKDDVVCVTKEAVQDKHAVSLKLKGPSSCRETKVRLESVLQELCGEDCKLDIYQEDNSDEIVVSGKYVEGDVTGMADKFNNDNIRDKTNVEEAVVRWGKNSKLVLVSLLLTGLLLAALLVAGYYLKTHRKNSKGVRLAESFQVDEENQANTLVSVAPLPQEPVDKPTVNGESPPENGTNAAPTTNGHSANQTPVADTEM
ncbi:hematopoietic progenitor cell antigen CD34 isoform X2 [Mugil cephalus]|uniref:hematopoietic progenitor cell antigen CD34 isoform X2 n=1 Tax=Mugil cephalus TaxID=48193 RepID=UPI001FB58718|nr:hematopoietic progenitor cell antigen CD34 isoform X2 [Mugil cephalus]